MKIRLPSLAAALLCLHCSIVYAEDESELEEIASTPLEHASEESTEGIVIEGDKLQVQMDRRMKAIGNAELHQDGKNIYGDTIQYDQQNDEMHVIGNAKIESQGSTITGPELRLSLSENTGEMPHASFKLSPGSVKMPQANLGNNKNYNNDYYQQEEQITGGTQQLSSQSTIGDGTMGRQPKQQVGPVRGDADYLGFEGEDKKKLKGGRFTTCEVGRDDWYIKAGELELDDYTKTVTARNARVEFQNVPILYTPWIEFSYINQRKTGLLAPTWGTTTRSGFELLTPFYWNIAPDMDATIATRYLGNRGLQYQGEYRYLGESYAGIDNIEYLPSDSATGEKRWYGRLKHDQVLGNGWRAGYNFEKVSDDKYFSELSTRITVTSRVNLPQQAYLTYGDDVWNFYGLVQKYQTLNATDATTVSYPYERMPQLTLTGNKDFGSFNGNLYSEWVSFDRQAGSSLSGLPDTNQTLVTQTTGSRMTIYPSISLPLAQPYGYLTPKVGLHYTKYSLNGDTDWTILNNSDGTTAASGQFESTSRTLPIVSVDGGLFFDRKVRVVNNSYTQTLEPRMFYVYIPYRDQSNLPVFDTSLADLSMTSLFLENQFVGNDRINNANQLTLSVTSRMIDNRTGEQRLAATIGQRFYFEDQRVALPGANLRTGDTSDIVTALTAKLLTKWYVDTAWLYNVDRSRTTKANILARYNPEPGKTLNFGYRYTEDRLDQINVSSQWPLGQGFYGLGRWNYSLQENRPIEGLAGVEYDAGCWQARGVLQRVSTATAKANYALFFQLELGGLASIGSNPLTLLNRGIPGYTSAGLIPDSIQQQQSNYE